MISAPKFLPDSPAFSHDKVEGDGARLHVVSGGEGPPLVLIHGFLSTWLLWRHIMPELAERHWVIVPDLRGFGDSDRPSRGYDKTTLARDVLAVLDTMGVTEFDVLAHDFGCQIGYRMATLARERVRSMVVIEGLLPGIETSAFPDPTRFWFYTFNQVPDLPELFSQGKERLYLEHFYRDFLYDRSVLPPEEMDEYVRTYGSPGGLRCGFELYRTGGEDLAAFKPEYERKLDMPVLAMGGDHSFGDRCFEAFSKVASNVAGEVVERCGHYAPMERPAQVLASVGRFLESGASSEARPATAPGSRS